MVELIIVKLLAFLAIFYKLVTTNHWSTGKKLLVALSGAMVIESFGAAASILLNINSCIMLGAMAPTILVALMMVYLFYRKEFIY